MKKFGNWKKKETVGKYTFISSDFADDTNAISDGEISHYDGYLVAESIKNGSVSRLIEMAPEMRRLLIELIDIEGPQPATCYWYRKVKSILEFIEGVE